MISINNPKDCCGCTACVSICTHNAISMIPNPLGFLYPKVDVSRCVDCGLCDTVCQFNDKYDCSLNLVEPIAYAARHKDISEVMRSRSGAVFVALSDSVIENGGVVYGAGYQDHFRVVHKRATTKNERDEFRGSKYVQSDLTGVFRNVKDDLRSGLIVLFSGTPCQTAGLNAFVGKKYRKHLYLIDIVCHGVPAPYLWRDYINYLEKKQGCEVLSLCFRNKERFGWANHVESFCFENGEISSSLYTTIFYQHIALRQSCGICPYTNLNRPSDITLADYWGWERTDPSMNVDDKGCSLVLCNTDRGKLLLEDILSQLNYVRARIDNVIQPNLQKPSVLHPLSAKFEECYSKYGFVKTLKKFGYLGIRHDFKSYYNRFKSIIRKQL